MGSRVGWLSSSVGRAVSERRLASPFGLAAFGAAAVIVIADALDRLIDPPASDHMLVLLALLDSPAHLATGFLVLAAWQPSSGRTFSFGVLVASVVLDLDHVPQALGWWDITRSGHEVWPFHNLLAVAVLVSVAALAARMGPADGCPRGRVAVIAGAALGVAGHLGRDLATGGAFPLWPVTAWRTELPYPAYATTLAMFVILAWRRSRNYPPRESLSPLEL